MHFSTRAEYGVRLLIELGRHADHGEPTPLHAVAAVEGLPLSYLEQLAARLRKAGIVSSTRGAHGGYRLARPAAEITMDQAIDALEGPIAPMQCLSDDGSHKVLCSHERDGGHNCATRVLWASVQDGMLEALRRTSLADLVDFSRCHESRDGADMTPLPVAASL